LVNILFYNKSLVNIGESSLKNPQTADFYRFYL
jgi:hypothetical protein